MDHRKPREVIYHRGEQTARSVERLDALKPSAPGPAEEADDDAPVSSDVPDSEELVGPPDYGELGTSRRVPGELEIEPVSGYRGKVLELAAVERSGTSSVMHMPDAWYAEFGHPGLTALMRRPEMIRAMAEVMADTDDRVPITETEAYPWRCICALTITARDGSRWLGTGWLAGPRTVITAGHCIYMHTRGGWVSQVEVIPGCNGDYQPYGTGIATSFRSVKGWTRKQKRTHDYGAIILPVERAFGSLLGYFGFINLSDLDLEDLKVNLAGYPGDKARGTQWYHARRLEAIRARTLEYRIDTAGGQSGSPVWRLKNSEQHVVGIHTNGDVAGNSATRITDPVFQNISAWKKEGS